VISVASVVILFFATREDCPSEDTSSPQVLESGILNLASGSAAL
jgi:hypothetical protein